MSDPVLSQLVTVESDLSQQVESLDAKLTQIREQRDGLRTVIGMFGSNGSAAPAISVAPSEKESVTAAPAESEPAPRRSVGRPSSKTASKTAANKTAANKTATKRKTSSPKAATETETKTAQKKKKDGRAASWQKYVQTDYKDAALPEAVSSVLRSAPSDVFTIADVMSSIFRESMPRTSYLKARNRISNILSAGARDGTWYRGRNGRYSQSESVMKIK